MIPDEDVERVRDNADIVQIIGEHVNLRRVGADWRGPCPFHQGTHRNFSVSPKKRMYYCFVCHAGGDVFNFLQKRLGLDWPSAVRSVAEKSGIEIREVEARREGPDPREPVWEVNAAAAEYFQRMLWDDELGGPAREYLAKRHVSREAAEKFGLGFAPREIGLLRSYLNTLGYDDARLLTAGLLVQREEAEEPRPRFRGRLMFPIYDASGRPSGFGGRLIGPGEPKYLNSADSVTFTKGRLLYGLNWARHAIRRDERLLLVEGYFDVVRLVLAGIESVVAPLGTALTEDQASMISRQTKNVFLLYDSDTAGQKATFRAGDLLLAQGVSVRVVTLPDGEDPDTFVDSHGGAALETHIDGAVDVFDRKVQILERQGWFADLHKRRRAIDRLLPTIRATADLVTRDMYIARASEASGVDRNVLAREAGSANARGAGARAPAATQPHAHQEQMRMGDRRVGERREARGAAARRPPGSGPAVERYLLRVILAHPAYLEMAAEADVGPATFEDVRYREIFETLTRIGADASPEVVVRELSADAALAYDEMLGEPPESLVNLEVTYRDTVAALRIRELKQKNSELQRLMATARSEEEKNVLLAEKDANARKALALRTRAS
ncbi:MAG TPA: DNA primase [Gemmatimonadaceae bacterium]|nr:DNA primase [Gemmatimonadaceae bacterium]